MKGLQAMTDVVLRLEHFSNAGLSAEELYPGIFVVDNFLTPGELVELKDYIDGLSQEDWSKSYTESLFAFIEDQYGVKTMEEAQALGHAIKVDEYWVDKNATLDNQEVSMSINSRLQRLFSQFPELELKGVGSIQRQYEGIELSYHVDSESNPDVVFANVLYVNDDFIDGELHFPRIDVKYKPKKGALIVFPSSDEYFHGVLPVGAGPTRYALPAFVNRKV
jgi:hypothetical protein